MRKDLQVLHNCQRGLWCTCTHTYTHTLPHRLRVPDLKDVARGQELCSPLAPIYHIVVQVCMSFLLC